MRGRHHHDFDHRAQALDAAQAVHDAMRHVFLLLDAPAEQLANARAAVAELQEATDDLGRAVMQARAHSERLMLPQVPPLTPRRGS